MPSVISLQEQRYYANPRNQFWWIMSQVCGFSSEASYQEKTLTLTERGFAIWDVLKECQRSGSADSNIVRSSEKVNDIDNFLNDHPSVRLIAFNGQAARRIFMRHCSSVLTEQLSYCLLPSTSPAYAAMTPNEKLQTWLAELMQI